VNLARQWERREALFFQGAPLALIPAISFLPALAFLVLTPRFSHAPLVAAAVFPILGAAEIWGITKLIRCVQHDFDLLTILAFGVFVVLAVIAIYTGFWLAALALGG
jgi:hypothetical protein